MTTSHKLFVYGTLKRGMPAHYRLDGSAFLGHATLAGFDLYDLGPYPAAVLGTHQVHGEVYEVPDLEPFDVYEGFPHLYDRMQVSTSYGDVWIYFMRDPDFTKAFTCSLLKEGDWNAY